MEVTVYKNPNEIYYYIGVSTDKVVQQNLVGYKIPETTWAIIKRDKHFLESVNTTLMHLFLE